ncbi:MAG: ribosome maturation factor RimM [Saccharofermentanales bacterium]
MEIGRITAPHGVLGEVRVMPLTERNERFAGLRECYLTSPDETEHRLVKLKNTREQPPFILVTVEGITNREAAEKLRGWFLSVDRENAIELPPGKWFICDLIGFTVIDKHNGELGKLKDINQQTAQDVYVVAQKGQPDLLFPAAADFIIKIDPEAKRIDTALPAGLVELYRPGSETES